MKYVGIDGCKSGWFYVGIDDRGSYSVGIIQRIEQISEWLGSCSLVLVDIPLGLLSKGPGERVCDVEARHMIKPRGSTVFPVPARSALARQSYEAASAENLRCLGRKLSKQTWAIAHKIKEVDDFLVSRRPGRTVREMHPEVAFCGLNGGQPILTNKKRREGFDERVELLKGFYSDSYRVVDTARSKYSKKELQNDDILDALVGAITATFSPSLSTLPVIVPVDDEGLPMEIVYARSKSSSIHVREPAQ